MRARSLVAGVLAIVAPVTGALAERPAKPSNLTNYFVGNPVDSPNEPNGGPALLLMGGGSEVTQAFVQDAYPVINGGDIVVLRASGGSGYQNYFWNGFTVASNLRPNSVETLVVNTRSKANSSYVRYAVEHAEMIWIAGGDQSEYIDLWAGTALESAVRHAYARGAVVGGTSAGAQILGEWIYHPDSQSAATSAEAVANPYRSSMLLATDFFQLPAGYDLVVDPHFTQRDRLGRLAAFMARLREDRRSSRVIGVGIDEGASIFIRPDGSANVRRQSGTRYVFVVRESRLGTFREQVQANAPLIYGGLERIRLFQGDTYNFRTGASSATPTQFDVAGSPPEPPY